MFHAVFMVMEQDSIGVRLRSARESAGLTIDDVHFRTKLPKSVIVALEAEDFASFPGPVYARSFLAQYSEYLKVDADEWVDALEPGGFAAHDGIGDLVEAPGETEDRPHGAGRSSHTSSSSLGGWLAMPMFMLFSAAVVVLAMKGYEHFETKSREEEPQAAEPGAPPSPVETPAPQAPAQEPDEERRETASRDEDRAGKPPPRAIIVR
ncbi:MAG: helix-turn-helix domain-containing protein [Verrucomicrobiae bacterium]|nr:helix-turn-helix domain-containing protein [Verrucomicrobiae bacterium]